MCLKLLQAGSTLNWHWMIVFRKIKITKKYVFEIVHCSLFEGLTLCTGNKMVSDHYNHLTQVKHIHGTACVGSFVYTTRVQYL